MSEPDHNDSLPRLALSVSFLCCCYKKQIFFWHYGAIKAQKHIEGYGRSSHMTNALSTLLALPLPPLLFLSLLTTSPPNQLTSPSKQIRPHALCSLL